MRILSTEGTESSEGFQRALALVGAGASARAVAKVAIAAISFATTALVVRLLGATIYGALAFGLSMLGLASAITAGFGIAATRTLAADVAVGDYGASREVTRGLITVVGVGGAVGLALLLSVIGVTQRQLDPMHRFVLGLGLGLLLVGRSAAVAGGAVARGFGHVVMMEVPGFVEVLSKFLLVLALVTFGVAGLGGVAMGYGIAGVAAAIAAAEVIRRTHADAGRVFRPTAAAALQLLRVTAPYAIAVAAFRLIESLDVAVLGATHPGTPVGSYAPTLLLVETLVMLAPMLFAAVFVTAATGLIEAGKRESFSRLYVTVSRFSIVVAMPAFMLLASAPGAALKFAYGEHFPIPAGVVPVLLVGFFVTVAFGFNSQALVASGERWRLARAFVWPGATMVASCLALIPLYGAIGAATATTASFVVLNVSLSWTLFRATGTHPFHRNFVLLVVTAPCAILTAVLLHRLTGGDFWIAVCTSFFVWVGWVLLARLLGAFYFGELRGLLPKRRPPQSIASG